MLAATKLGAVLIPSSALLGPEELADRLERGEARDPLFLYFTSGTTSKPKLVEHSHASYPIGHPSTMFWIGCRRFR